MITRSLLIACASLGMLAASESIGHADGEVVVNSLTYKDNGKLSLQVTFVNSAGGAKTITGYRGKIDAAGCYWNKSVSKPVAAGAKESVRSAATCSWVQIAKVQGCDLKKTSCTVPVVVDVFWEQGGEKKSTHGTAAKTVKKPAAVAPAN